MRIRKTQWAVWNKKTKRFVKHGACIVFPSKFHARLIAGKERKDSPYKVIKLEVKII